MGGKDRGVHQGVQDALRPGDLGMAEARGLARSKGEPLRGAGRTRVRPVAWEPRSRQAQSCPGRPSASWLGWGIRAERTGSLAASLDSCTPPPPRAQTRARFWFQHQKCGNTGSPCLDKPVLARGTYCGTQVAGIAQPIVHDYERVSNRPAYTPEYRSTWNYSCSNTLSPILTLPASCTKL